MNIKKIIAIEGLIILCIALIGGALWGAGLFLLTDKPTYVYEVTGRGKTQLVERDNYVYGDEKKILALELLSDEELNKLERITAEKETVSKDELSKLSPPTDFKARLVKTKHSVGGILQQICLTLGMTVLFAAYPIYLIVLFVIWSIKTLRKK